MNSDNVVKAMENLRGRLPLIVYELNEVPWRVVDWYIKLKPESNLAGVLQRSASFTTVTHDNGELHPWTTWPTVHRGVYNSEHNIRFINQDLSSARCFPPIWETLANSGFKVGVFGSLQSYPVPSSGKYSFYIPDTFARSPETFPKRYSAFQRINLRQTASDGATVSRVKVDGSVISDAIRLPFIGVRPGTFLALASQLKNERTNNEYRTRRSLMQAPLAFDVFVNAYNRTRPEFTTFFTNHVAGAMHRYWRYAFPDDFAETNVSSSDDFKRGTILKAMDIADRQIGMLCALADRDGGSLLILSSMGQEAAKRPPYHGELRVVDSDQLAKAIGFIGPVKANLAMQPDFNFEFESTIYAEEFLARATRLRDREGKSIWFRATREGTSVNLGLGAPKSVLESGRVYLFNGSHAATAELSLADIGVSKIYRDPGTGYHQPEGIMIWHGGRQRIQDQQRGKIESVRIRDMMLYVVSRA
ncbi:hypothetical protein A6V36_35755 [Paraburkholderia ginsengiterrae]|uniref:Uncharacterized protein n=1 Tax=Paraburkholderia ginsengiterrae TaxID=1462993 RepID=A0A1A9MZJ3_9BURK|nr:hypothetical protein [Paraburkholderia ginsengiterrae]OAJ53697.1 hypothetical protein A6V37_35290 [Paraburkholderia ginsengiterrae]OAJ54720.1 hypothetical protein A6V36_35755 [Paraburkholderia ginsengiterrae]